MVILENQIALLIFLTQTIQVYHKQIIMGFQ